LLNELEKLSGEQFRIFNLDEIPWMEISDKNVINGQSFGQRSDV
jgi:hypothetical protein